MTGYMGRPSLRCNEGRVEPAPERCYEPISGGKAHAFQFRRMGRKQPLGQCQLWLEGSLQLSVEGPLASSSLLAAEERHVRGLLHPRCDLFLVEIRGRYQLHPARGLAHSDRRHWRLRYKSRAADKHQLHMADECTPTKSTSRRSLHSRPCPTSPRAAAPAASWQPRHRYAQRFHAAAEANWRCKQKLAHRLAQPWPHSPSRSSRPAASLWLCFFRGDRLFRMAVCSR